MQLTNIEYGVLMQAIKVAHNENDEELFIDPYDNEEDITSEQVKEALESVELKLYNEFVK